LVFITGTFLETLPYTIILAPILAPIAANIRYWSYSFYSNFSGRRCHWFHNSSIWSESLCSQWYNRNSIF